MEEEIIEALSEWPVTNSVYNQTSPIDKIDNPHSVSAFFLRNVGKTSKTGVKVQYVTRMFPSKNNISKV